MVKANAPRHCESGMAMSDGLTLVPVSACTQALQPFLLLVPRSAFTALDRWAQLGQDVPGSSCKHRCSREENVLEILVAPV